MGILATAAVLVVVLQVLNAGAAVAQSVDGQKLQFDIPDTLIMTYSTPSQRNQVLQQILVMWRNALNEYQSSNVEIKFKSESIVTSTQTQTADAQPAGRRMRVMYHITGQSVLPVDVPEVTDSAHQSILDAHVAGVELVGGDESNASQSDDSQDGSAQLFSTTETVTLTYTSVSQRTQFLQQILTFWKTVLASFKVTNLKITFVSESSASARSKLVTYRISATTSSTVDERKVKSTVRQKIQAAHLSGIQVASATGTQSGNDAQTTDASTDAQMNTSTDTTAHASTNVSDDSSQSKTASDNAQQDITGTSLKMTSLSAQTTVPTTNDDGSMKTDTGIASADEIKSVPDQTIKDTIPLSYATTVDRDLSIEWIRRLWAYVLGVEVQTVRVAILSDNPIPSSFLGFLQTGTQGHNVTYTVTIVKTIADFDAEALKTKFQELLPASTTSYLVTFPSGNIPATLNITDIDQIRGPQKTKDVEQQNLQTFLIYDTISFSFKTTQERNKILETIRRSWEQALGRGAVTVDLVVHNDTPNPDGTHLITYLITILSKRNEWDIKTFEAKFRQVLSDANIPSLIVPDSTSVGSFTSPPADDGVRSFVFYDNVDLTYTTQAQKAQAIEAIRKVWQQVLGSNAWNVQVSVYKDSTSSQNAHQVSYTILFSSQNQTDWDFDDLETKFQALLPGVQGTGFSVAQAQERSSGSDDVLFRAHHIEANHGPQKESSRKSNAAGSVKESMSSSSDSLNVFNYFLSDAMRVEYVIPSDLNVALESIRQQWIKLLGSKASDVQVSINSDFKAARSSKHTIHFHILIISAVAHMESNLQNIQNQFWSSLSTSDNVLLRRAKRIIVLPLITGNLELVLNGAASNEQNSEESNGNVNTTDQSSDQASTTSSSTPKKPDSESSKIFFSKSAASDHSTSSNNSSSSDQSDRSNQSSSSDQQETGDEAAAMSSPTTKKRASTRSKIFFVKSTAGDQSTSPVQTNSDQSGSSNQSSSSNQDDVNTSSDSGSGQVVAVMKVTAKYQVKDSTSVAPGKDAGSSDETDESEQDDSDDESASDSSESPSSLKNANVNKSRAQSTSQKIPSSKATTKRQSSRLNTTVTSMDDSVTSSTDSGLGNNQGSEDSSTSSSLDNNMQSDSLQSASTMLSSISNTKMDDRRGDHGKGPLEVRGSITIRYNNNRERDDAISEIKRRWNQADILAANVDELKISFDREIFPQWAQLGPDNTAHTLMYHVSWMTRRGRDKLDERDVRRELREVLARSQFSFYVDRQVDEDHRDSGDSNGFDDQQNADGFRDPSFERSMHGVSGSGSSRRDNRTNIRLVHQLNAYIIHDSFRITAENDNERDAYFEKIEQAWQQVFGNDTELVQAAVYEDVTLSGKNFKTHDVKYAVVIVSSNPSLDLQAAKASFAKVKPDTRVALVAPEPRPVSSASNALVLLQSVTFNYASDKERDDFISGIEQEWQLALGKGIQLAEVWLYDEAVIDQSLDVIVKTTSELSYAVLVVSNADILDANALMRQFEQHLLTKLISFRQAANSTACNPQVALI